MVTPSAGAIVAVPFPFSNLRESKLRPAIVLAYVGRNDWILCQVTSKQYGDGHAVRISENDIFPGSLRIVSYARPGKLFTASRDLMVSRIGDLKPDLFDAIVGRIIEILRGSITYSEESEPPKS